MPFYALFTRFINYTLVIATGIYPSFEAHEKLPRAFHHSSVLYFGN